jgi:hypothetical protein
MPRHNKRQKPDEHGKYRVMLSLDKPTYTMLTKLTDTSLRSFSNELSFLVREEAQRQGLSKDD